jgi:hypothetical protein
MKLKHLVVAVSLSLGLTACGGDGDSTNAASYDFTVTAIDGYLANAIVTATCGNQTFTGVTNASGVAQIDTNGIASTNCAIAITANPDGSTTDIDTDDKYAANSLYLLSPAGQSGNLVATPFTTMVALLVESSGGSLDLASAIQEVATQFGVSTSVVTGDFVALKDVKAALKASALLPSLPKTAAAFAAIAADESATDALITKLENINTAVDAQIEELENSGVDLSTVVIDVTVADDGTVTTVVVDKETGEPTGATGGTSGGGTGN